MKIFTITTILSIMSVSCLAQETLQTVTDRGNTTTNSLQVGGNYVNSNTTKLFINNASGKNFALSSGANMISEQGFHIYNWTDNQNSPLLSLSNNGYLGIGTVNPTQKITVNGSINIVDATLGNYLGFGQPGQDEYNTLGSMYSSAGLALAHGLKPSANDSKLMYSYGTMSRSAIVLGKDFASGGITFYTKPSSSEIVGNVFSDAPRMTIADEGNVGIGTSSPGNYKLNVMGPLSSGVNDYSYNSATFQLTNESKVDGISAISPTGAFRWYTNPNNSTYGGFLYQLRVYDLINGESGGLLTINGFGNLGIGVIDTKGYKLAVNGKIRAQEIKVEASPWPDYVFTKDYHLPTLEETEKHIKEKGHLPGIPSAEEVKNNGIDLGEMNAKLLQKIEELTLMLIRMKKEGDLQQKINSEQNALLQAEINALKLKQP